MKRMILLLFILSGLAIVACACAVASAKSNPGYDTISSHISDTEASSENASDVVTGQAESFDVSSAVSSGRTRSSADAVSHDSSSKNQSSSNTSSNNKPVLQGDPIDFTVGVSVNIHASNSKPMVKLVKTYEELEAIYNNDGNPNRYSYIEKYDSSFFEQKAVIVLFSIQGSGSYKIRMDSLIKKDNTLTVCYERIIPEVGTCDMAYWRIVLEVNKSDIENITDIQECSYTTRS